MAAKTVIVDTGPLVAIVDASSEAHAACKAALSGIRGPLITCWPVLTEAAYLLRKVRGGLDALLTMVETGAVGVRELPPDSIGWIRRFAAKYADQRPDLADAAVVYLAETHDIRTVFTIDYRDLAVYRSKGRAFTLLPGPGWAR